MLVLALFIGISAATAAPGAEININAELTQITSTGTSIEDAVKQLVAAHPELAASITTAAITLMPDHAAAIATAAVDAAPDQVNAIRIAAIAANPDQSGAIVVALQNPAEGVSPSAAGGDDVNTLAPSGAGAGSVTPIAFNTGTGGSGGGGGTVSP